MTFQEQVANTVTAKLYVTAFALLCGWGYLFFGPDNLHYEVVGGILDFLQAVTIAFMLGEAGLHGIRAIGDHFGNGKH